MAKKVDKYEHYKAQIEKLDLSDFEKDQVVCTWLKYMTWVDGKSVINRRGFDVWQIITIVTGAAIPILEGLRPEGTSADALSTAQIISMTVMILGAVVSIGTALSRHFGYEEKWSHYRRSAELVKLEGEDYLALTNNYNTHDSHQEAYGPFMARIINLKRQELSAYMENQSNNVSGPGDSSDAAVVQPESP